VVYIFGYDEVDSDLRDTALFQSFQYDFGASFQNSGKDVNKLGKYVCAKVTGSTIKNLEGVCLNPNVEFVLMILSGEMPWDDLHNIQHIANKNNVQLYAIQSELITDDAVVWGTLQNFFDLH
jgi:hypothetical protein